MALAGRSSSGRVTNCETGGAAKDELMIERTIEDIAEALGPHGAAPDAVAYRFLLVLFSQSAGSV